MTRDVCAVLVGVAMMVTLGATSATVRAEDLGCCRIECSGPNGRRVIVTETTASECQTSSLECRAEWSGDPCPGVPAGAAGDAQDSPD